MKMDGLYDVSELRDELEISFKSEKDLCDFIERNVENFCLELGFEYNSHKREAALYEVNNRRFKGSKRIDFIIITKCGRRLGIECKHPHYISELSAGVGQILSYITITDSIDQFYLISSKIDLLTPFILKKFDLPIVFIAMDKKTMLTWQPQLGTNTL